MTMLPSGPGLLFPMCHNPHNHHHLFLVLLLLLLLLYQLHTLSQLPRVLSPFVDRKNGIKNVAIAISLSHATNKHKFTFLRITIASSTEDKLSFDCPFDKDLSEMGRMHGKLIRRHQRIVVSRQDSYLLHWWKERLLFDLESVASGD